MKPQASVKKFKSWWCSMRSLIIKHIGISIGDHYILWSDAKNTAPSWAFSSSLSHPALPANARKH